MASSTLPVHVGGLHVNTLLYNFVEKEVFNSTPGGRSLGLDSRRFWAGLEDAIRALQPHCEVLLQKRESLQRQIDNYHCTTREEPFNRLAYKRFLYEIGYLVDQGPDFSVMVDKVDSEIASVPAPQLVVPLSNARFAINATNARWGSLFDSFYGSDIIPESSGLEKNLSGSGYNAKRGALVIQHTCQILDMICPLTNGSFSRIKDVQIRTGANKNLFVEFLVVDHTTQASSLKDPSLFVGYSGDLVPDAGVSSGRFSILLCHHGLHIELVFDKTDAKAMSEHPAALKDVILESAVSTIQDCEDSVAAVDAEDKVALYRNWLKLTLGTLSFDMPNGSIRTLNPDRHYRGSSGYPCVLPGRSLMLIRNVGHHMLTHMVTLSSTGNPIPEGFLDAFVTSLIALYDLKGFGKYTNSRAGSIYIVKPKQHGPEEVALTNQLFDMVERTLGLAPYTIKLGLMDEERRTSLNLKACIREAQRRTIFINTGFLDRTGDEIHTNFELGPFDLKNNLKTGQWIQAYEKQNVMIGLQCGLLGRGQIGKGMWAEPDGMKAMMESKIKHPQSGATTAWVPSPKAATLHSIHFHQVHVHSIQQQLLKEIQMGQCQHKNENSGHVDSPTQNENPLLNDLLNIQVLPDRFTLSASEIQKEIDNNLQGLLGYVVRWVEQGIGCSKVLDINGTGLMEDRATLRISSQHVANWLHHRIVTEGQVFDTMRSMAAIVDQQNKKDPNYKPMESRPFTSLAYQAALDLVFKGARQPNGYTEYILHKKRVEAKKRLNGEEWEDGASKPGGSISRWCKM